MHRLYGLIAAAMLAAIVFMPPAAALPGDADAIARASALDDDPADFAAVTQVCTRCHVAAQFLGAPRSSSRWEQTYARMSQNGATGSIDQLNRVVHYFQKNLTIINLNTSPAEELGPTLQVDDGVVDRIVARRAERPFKGVGELVALPGVDREIVKKLDARKLLQF